MSADVDGTPIGMWKTEDIRDALNGIVSCQQYDRALLLIAEGAVRALDIAKAAYEALGNAQ